MDYQRKLDFLQQCSDTLSQQLENTKLDALDYSQIVQVILNIQSEIRRTRFEQKYNTDMHKTPALPGYD
jgi:hypothetical protein